MESTGKLKSLFSPENFKLLGIIFGVLAIVTGIVVGTYYALKVQSVTATESNISRIRQSQILTLEDQYNLRYSSITDIKWSNVPSNQQLLINLSMVGCRSFGYLGPFIDGVYDEDNGVLTALRTGARLFILDINIDPQTGDPALMYRNAAGYVKSLNIGSIKKIGKSLAGRAFSSMSSASPPAINYTPIILVLYFQETPDIVKQSAKYIKFLSKVAVELQDLSPFILGQTAQGDFRRQGLDTQLFFQPWQLFRNKVILLTNVDTSPMRNPSTYGVSSLSTSQDLDLMVNARMYCQETGVSFGATTVASKASVPAVIITQPSYFLTTPPNQVTQAIDTTKKCFTITMDPNPEIVYTKSDITSLITEYGVHCVPFVYFMKPEQLTPFIGTAAPFHNAALIVKPLPLRFVPPEDIVLQNPSQKTNTQGGFVKINSYS